MQATKADKSMYSQSKIDKYFKKKKLKINLLNDIKNDGVIDYFIADPGREVDRRERALKEHEKYLTYLMMYFQA